MKSYTFWSDRHAQTRQNFRVSQLLKQNSIKVPSPAKLSERTHATRKINTTIAFLAFDIKVSLKEPHRSLHKKHWKWKRSIRHFVFIPQMDAKACWENIIRACRRGWFPGIWLAEGQRKKEFQTVQHPWSSVRSTLVRTLFKNPPFSCDLVQNHRDLLLNDVFKGT